MNTTTPQVGKESGIRENLHAKSQTNAQAKRETEPEGYRIPLKRLPEYTQLFIDAAKCGKREKETDPRCHAQTTFIPGFPTPRTTHGRPKDVKALNLA
jgi:hypothetical protein